MSTQTVRDTLTNENELLLAMIDFVQKYPSAGFTNQALYIQKSWARFLGERHATNAQLSKKADGDLEEDLKEEKSQVEQYLGATVASPDYSEQWASFLQCERDILDHLIGLCGKQAQ
jgi:hypothetical protein